MIRKGVLFVLFNYCFVVGMSLFDRSAVLQSQTNWMEAWMIAFAMAYIGNELLKGNGPRPVA